MATKTSTQELSSLGINLVKSKTAFNEMVAANQVNADELYLIEGEEATTYTFTDGIAGNFTVTPSTGSAQTVSVGKPAAAGTADNVDWSGVTNKPSSYTPASHTHGNITNAGELSTASRAVVTDANKKITVADLTVSSATAENTTATTFVYSVTQDAQGKITVKTRPLPTYNNYSLPLAASGTRGGIQIGYSESGTNYAVKLSSEKAYVTVPWTDYRVRQTNDASTNANYRLLLSNSASDTQEDQISRKNANLIYNPSTNKLSTGNLDLTGALDVTGNAYFHNETQADSLTAGSLLVNGNTSFAQSPTAPTPASGDNSTKLATTEFVKNSVTGLSGAMHFKGTTTSSIVDGSTTNPIVIGGSNYTAAAGDVVLREITSGNIFEYVWTGSAWEMLGRDTSFKVTQTAVSSPAANGSTTAFIDTISQDANGNITVTKKNLDTSGTWSGTATKATSDGSGNNIVNTYLTKAAGVSAVSWDSTNKKITRTINGTAADVVQFVAGSNVTLTGASGKLTIASTDTDRYVNSASFAHDSTNDNVKMTLTRAGSDTATVTANIPKVSSSSAGVAPKGAAVSTQSQTTKFLREDGTWAAPSYTTSGAQITSGTIDFARLPTMYWANVAISNTSSTTTSPTFQAPTIKGETQLISSGATSSASNTVSGFRLYKSDGSTLLAHIGVNDSGGLGFYGKTLFFRPNMATDGTIDSNSGVTMDSGGLYPGSTSMPLGKSANPWGDAYINHIHLTDLQKTVSSTTYTYSLPNKNGTIALTSDITDTKVNVKARGTTKAYLLATSTSPTSSNQAVESLAETGVYLDTTAGKLVATTFVGALNGNADSATKATNDSDDNPINTTYIKKSIGTTAGDMIYWSANGTPVRLGIGSNNQVLKAVNGVPTWQTEVQGETINSVANSFANGTTAGPTLTTTVNSVSSTAVAIPAATKTQSGIVTTTTQRFSGRKGFGFVNSYGQNDNGEASQYCLDIYIKNNADTQVGEIWYNAGNATNISSGQYNFRQFSPNSTPNTSTTGYHETYKLPSVAIGLTENKNYDILTTKTINNAGNAALPVYFSNGIPVAVTNLQTQLLKRPNELNGVNDVTIQPIVNTARANRLAFLPADQIIIEKTTDGGTTWTDAGISDDQKLALFSEQRPAITLPLLNNKKDVKCGLRVTFSAMKYNVPSGTAETAKYNYWNSNYVASQERYSTLEGFYFWLSSNTDGMRIKVERATGGASTTWTTLYENNNWAATGWSGADWVSIPSGTFGGGTTQTGNYWNYRITFMTSPTNGQTAMSTSNTTSAQSIHEIRGYGVNYWGGNTYMAKDHLYSFDANKNATFPANVTATKFIGPLQGNADTATKATQDSDGNAINTTYLKLSGGTMTGVLTVSSSNSDSYSGALNMNNSNIYGLNAIYTADAADGAGEGISFYRDTTHVDTLWVNGGDLLFVPNRELGTNTSKANSQKVARFTTNPTSGQVVITDGTTGGVKTTGYTIASSVPSNAVFTDTTYTFNTTAQTNKIQYKITGASSWTDIPITISITNNITGSGTSGYLTKFNGANTITNGPQLGTDTTKFLNNKGEWAVPPGTYSLPTATSSALGGVKIGSGISIDSNGVISVSASGLGIPDALMFKGSLGTGGTVTSLAAASSSNEGFVYKVITAGTYQGVAAKVGDLLISNGSEWVLIPSGDEPSNTTGSTDTSSKIYLVGATSQTASAETYSDNEVYATSGVLTAKTFNSTSLTASQAVSTDASKNLVSTNLTVSDPAASGTGITYIASISQSAVGKITATKSTVRGASTSQTGVTQYTEANTNTQLATLPTWTATPTDSTYLIRRDTGGSATYGQVTFSTLWTYVSGKITDGIYWANEKATSAASYKAAPEMAKIKLNGNTSASAASTKNVELVYDSTAEVLNFVFT